jgi:hypothetical protein
VVKASITGSIIGNVLLVFGASILAGGIKFQEQRFNKTAARTSTTTPTNATQTKRDPVKRDPVSSVDHVSPGATGRARVSVPVVTISPAASGGLT